MTLNSMRSARFSARASFGCFGDAADDDDERDVRRRREREIRVARDDVRVVMREYEKASGYSRCVCVYKKECRCVRKRERERFLIRVGFLGLRKWFNNRIRPVLLKSFARYKESHETMEAIVPSANE